MQAQRALATATEDKTRRDAERAKELESLAADLAARQQSLADREAALDVREVRMYAGPLSCALWKSIHRLSLHCQGPACANASVPRFTMALPANLLHGMSVRPVVRSS